MRAASRDVRLSACAVIALLLGPVAASASATAGGSPSDRCTREDIQSAGPGASDADNGPHPSALPQANAIAAEAAHPLPAVTVEARPLPSPARRGFWPALFADHFDFASRLRAIRRLKIVPVFDNARVTVFLGVDRRGVAGLHIQQQDATDLPPLFARAAPFAEAPPLRAVPLRSP